MLPTENPFVLLANETSQMPANLKVIGVGGGGCNAIQSMINRGLKGVEFIAVNTDVQALNSNDAATKIQIGKNITRGLGAGADPNVGRKSAEEDKVEIEERLRGSDMVFITAGMGGGTGTGAAPVVASIAKSLGCLVVGIVTKPFIWEGRNRMKNAEIGIQEFRQFVDSLIVIPNSRISAVLDKKTSVKNAFDKPNDVLHQATRGISEIITIEGMINVDFADVRRVMSQSGDALIGVGIASGENRAVEAAQKAISSPLLEGVNIKGAKNILLNITSSENFTMDEIEEGNKVIYDAAGEDVDVIFGWVLDESAEDNVTYTIIATGFEKGNAHKQAPQVHTIHKQPVVAAPNYNQPNTIFENTVATNVNTNPPVVKAPTIQQQPVHQYQRGGYDLNKTPDKLDDISVPTFQRMNAGMNLHQVEENIIIPENTIKLTHSNLNQNVYREDEDTSGFLRQIMD